MLGIEFFYLFIDKMREEFKIDSDQAYTLREKTEKIFDGELVVTEQQAKLIFSSHTGFFNKFKDHVNIIERVTSEK